MSDFLGQGGLMSSGSWSPNSSAMFPDPFCDMSSLAMPESITYANRWCEYLMFANGTYFRALDRVLSYFITDIELSGIEDDDEKERIDEFLHSTDGLDVLDDIHTAGLNYMVYGNDFSSVIMPFRRYLSCKKCGFELPLKNVYNGTEFKFKWADYDFNATCPKCQYSGPWNHVDRRSGESGPLRVKHWSPHEIELLWDPYTDDVSYIWKIPEDYRKMIREGHLFHLERANWEIIQCVKNNTHLRFDKDVLYHMKESTLAGVRNRGWGISRVLANFRQAWYVQVLHRYNEAIALDYVIPFRLITPAPGPGSSDTARDALLNMNMGGYMSQVQRMIRERRKDPAGWNTLPFPVEYQALGGDATQLAPRDLLDQGIEILLNNVGVPVELYKGSLQVQSAPAALRLFESQWSHLVHSLNGYIGFLMKRLGQLLNWQSATARLEKVTHADDLQRQMSKLQLMMGGQVSQQTGLRSIGVDYFDETRRKMEEQKFEAEESNEAQEDMEQSAMMGQMAAQPQPGQPGDPAAGGAAPPGGAPPGGAPAGGMPPGTAGAIAGMPTQPNQPTTPADMLSKAQTIAQSILGMPEAQKDSELIQLKKQDPTLHSLVTSQIEDIRRQAQTQGGAMLMQQQFGKQGRAKKKPRPSVLDDWGQPFNTLPKE
jgi:hypothetical protein